MSKQTRSLEFGVQGPMMVGREPNAPYLSKVRVGLSVCPCVLSVLIISPHPPLLPSLIFKEGKV